MRHLCTTEATSPTGAPVISGISFAAKFDPRNTRSPFTIIAAIAQLERSLIVERVKSGLRRARAEGKHLGRPRLRIDARHLESVVNRRLTVREGAKELGISPSSFLRLVHQQYGSMYGSPAAMGGVG